MSYNSKDIVTMADMLHIRSRTAVYVREPTENACNVQIIKELTDNVLDEARDKSKVYKAGIHFFTDGTRYQVLVQDWGRGIPCASLKACYMKLHTSGKFNENDSAYSNSVGTNGMGAKATCALSERFVAMTKRNDGFGYLEVHRGVEFKHVLLPAIDKNKDTIGTVVFSEPDASILTASPTFMSAPDGLQALLDLIDFQATYKENIEFIVTVTNKLLTDKFFKQSEVEIWNSLRNYNGDKVIYHNICDKNVTTELRYEQYVRRVYSITDQTAIVLPTIFRAVNEEDPADRFGCGIYLFFTKHARCFDGQRLIGMVNMTPLSSNSSYHISKLISTLKETLSLFIYEKELREYFLEYYTLPVCGSVVAWFKRAVFVGQTKDAFREESFANIYTTFLRRSFNKISNEIWKAIVDLLYSDIQSAYNNSISKQLKTSRNIKDVTFILNRLGSYKPCNSADSSTTELFIMEGESAGGGIAKVRDPETQAILMLKGKPINGFQASASELLRNAVQQDFMTVLGVGPGDKTLDKLKFSNIILLTDADPDGYHIASLVIGNIYRINPLILKEGRVAIANPPLYSLSLKNHKLFLRDKRALDDMSISMFYNRIFKVYIRNLNTNKEYLLNPDCEIVTGAFRDFCYWLKRYGAIVNRVANLLIIDANYIELLAHCVDYLEPNNINPKKIKEILGLDDVIYRKDHGAMVLVTKGIEVLIPLKNLAKEIKSYILPELELLHWLDIDCYISTRNSPVYNHAPVTFMQLYQLLRSVDDQFSIQRNKGIGEMPDKDLYSCCIDPRTRSISRITGIGDLNKLYEMLGADVSARKKLTKLGHF